MNHFRITKSDLLEREAKSMIDNGGSAFCPILTHAHIANMDPEYNPAFGMLIEARDDLCRACALGEFMPGESEHSGYYVCGLGQALRRIADPE